IQDEITQNYTSLGTYRFQVGLTSPQIRFEELGAIAKPGLQSQGGDFLPGTRADYMTMNHFASFDDAGYTIALSNWDSFAMQVGSSSASTFDMSSPSIRVLATGNPSGAGITDQGGDTNFLNRFALQGSTGPYAASNLMKMSLAHQNPLVTIA